MAEDEATESSDDQSSSDESMEEEMLSFGRHESENSMNRPPGHRSTRREADRQPSGHHDSDLVEDPEQFSYRIGGELFILDSDRQSFLEAETIYHRFE
jgi:hypothetical protein